MERRLDVQCLISSVLCSKLRTFVEFMQALPCKADGQLKEEILTVHRVLQGPAMAVGRPWICGLENEDHFAASRSLQYSSICTMVDGQKVLRR